MAGTLDPQVTQLKTQCESLLEKHDEDIEEWYFEKQDEVGNHLNHPSHHIEPFLLDIF